MATNISIGNYTSRGRLKTQSFHKSLVDYWNFSGKGNMDTDRNIIKGIKGNKLTAYNFNWSLSSGYGLFKENYLTYRKADNVFILDDHSINVMNFIPANNWVIYRYGTEHLNATRVKVTGLTANNQLAYGYCPSNDGERALMAIPSDGEYDLPESIAGTTSYNVGFIVQNALTKNVTIEQIPQYKGAIILDGVDDYLMFNKRNYKIGTVIIRYMPLNLNGTWQYVFDAEEERTFAAHQTGTINTSCNNKDIIGDFFIFKYNTDTIKTITTPFYIGKSFRNNEFLSVALYDIAIYSDSLTNQQIKEEIDKINKYKLIADYIFNKNNNDADRDYIVNSLNPNERINLLNFDYALGSGYGLYKANFLQWDNLSNRGIATVTSDTIHLTETFGNANVVELGNLAYNPENITVDVTGDFRGVNLIYNYYISETESAQVLINTPGRYELPKSNRVASGFKTNKATKLDLTIKQIPDYPNHLVFDGVDDTTEPIPNLNSIQGTIMIQYDTMGTAGNNFAPIDENGLSMYQNGFIISSNQAKGTLQARGDDRETYTDLNTPLGNNISAFAYDSLGINLYNRENITETFHINKHSKYIFAKDASTNYYKKLALKRIKIFDRKLTRNQLDIEYNKLLNE